MDEQKKHFGSYQQGNERNNPMPTGLDLFRPSAFLRRSDTQSEEKIAHRPIPLVVNATWQAVQRTQDQTAKPFGLGWEGRSARRPRSATTGRSL
jgi:hypothetical protein